MALEALTFFIAAFVCVDEKDFRASVLLALVLFVMCRDSAASAYVMDNCRVLLVEIVGYELGFCIVF